MMSLAMAMSAICFRTSLGITVPVGLEGVLRMIILVLGVTAASIIAGSTTNSSSYFAET